jgi:hypothetical protein
MRRVLFHRDYRGFKGGHLKVFDYFDHTRSASGFQSAIYLTPDSIDDGRNPWIQRQVALERNWQPEQASLLFLAGTDWRAVPENIRKRPEHTQAEPDPGPSPREPSA